MGEVRTTLFGVQDDPPLGAMGSYLEKMEQEEREKGIGFQRWGVGVGGRSAFCSAIDPEERKQ